MATERADAKLLAAVCFRDSFAAQLIPFLAEHFERMLCIWDTNFDRAIIEHERPAVVIQEIVERALEGDLPSDSTSSCRRRELLIWPTACGRFLGFRFRGGGGPGRG